MDDIPFSKTAPATDSKRSMVEFASFFQRESEKIRDAGQAYANKKAQKSLNTLDQDVRIAQKVVNGATFVPGHPSRMRVLGRSNGPKFQYFVVHRPIGLDFNTMRKQGWTLAQLVSKATTAASVKEVVGWFRMTGSPACSQFVMGLDGQLIQMVDLCDIAYQILNLTHPRTGNPVNNGNSVGIELEGFVQPYNPKDLARFVHPGDPEREKSERSLMQSGFSPAMKQKLAWLLRWFYDNPYYKIPLDREHILLHSELDPSRRTDPGDNFQQVLREVLDMANAAPPISDFYAPAVSLAVAEDQAAKRFGAMQGDMSGLYAEIIRNAGASMQSTARASSVRQTGRPAYFSAASAHSTKLVAARAEDIASKIRSETGYINAKPAVQQNRRGLGFSFTTGTWNDEG